jgi:hypothetical protein
MKREEKIQLLYNNNNITVMTVTSSSSSSSSSSSLQSGKRKCNYDDVNGKKNDEIKSNLLKKSKGNEYNHFDSKFNDNVNDNVNDDDDDIKQSNSTMFKYIKLENDRVIQTITTKINNSINIIQENIKINILDNSNQESKMLLKHINLENNKITQVISSDLNKSIKTINCKYKNISENFNIMNQNFQNIKEENATSNTKCNQNVKDLKCNINKININISNLSNELISMNTFLIHKIIIEAKPKTNTFSNLLRIIADVILVIILIGTVLKQCM